MSTPEPQRFNLRCRSLTPPKTVATRKGNMFSRKARTFLLDLETTSLHASAPNTRRAAAGARLLFSGRDGLQLTRRGEGNGSGLDSASLHQNRQNESSGLFPRARLRNPDHIVSREK